MKIDQTIMIQALNEETNELEKFVVTVAFSVDDDEIDNINDIHEMIFIEAARKVRQRGYNIFAIQGSLALF